MTAFVWKVRNVVEETDCFFNTVRDEAEEKVGHQLYHTI
jgi:hypothetical protein